MANLQEIFNRIEEAKKEQREIKTMYRDALANSGNHKRLADEIKALKEKKKKIEQEIKDEMRSDFDKLDTLRLDIENDKMLLSDAAMSKMIKGETVEIKDRHDNKYEPVFTVKFKKL